MVTSKIGTFQLRPFSGGGWARNGAAAAPATAGFLVDIVLGAAVIKVGSTTAAAGLCSINVVATGTHSLSGTWSKTTVMLSRPPARLALSISSDVAVGKS
jgi:hypothetical protein